VKPGPLDGVLRVRENIRGILTKKVVKSHGLTCDTMRKSLCREDTANPALVQ
jgi:hypothetical protein